MLWRYILIFILFGNVLSTDLNIKLEEILKDNIAKYGDHISRVKRAEKSAFYMEKNKVDLPICQNMKGILGKFVIIKIRI